MARRSGGTFAVAAAIVAVVWLLGFGTSSATGFTSRGPFLVSSAPGRPLFDGAPFAPGESRTSCLTVRNDGAAAAGVRLYGRGPSESLDRSLHLTVTEGSGSCLRFRPDRVLFSGSLAAFPSSPAGGVADAHGRWAAGESHAYRFTVRLAPDPRIQGDSTRRSFVWVATSPERG